MIPIMIPTEGLSNVIFCIPRSPEIDKPKLPRVRFVTLTEDAMDWLLWQDEEGEA
jgi:hypothetical protein